jgi:uncharacterized NAD(P)/FAD-binding protein YdhS
MDRGEFTIAVVGGGLTGAAAAIAVLRRLRRPFQLVIVEGNHALGRGVAFGGHHPLHLLNVRTRDLSVLSDLPGDFLKWVFLQLDQGENDTGLHEGLAHSFLPRQLFGAYVRQRMFEAIDSRPDVRCTILDSVVSSCTRSGTRFLVKGEGRPSVLADVVFLATAYGIRSRSTKGLLQPFDLLPAEQLTSAKVIAFVGSGLSMVDALIGSRRDGFAGTAMVISRRGQLPRPHAAKGVVPLEVALPQSRSISRLTGAVRIACEAAAAHGTPWQAVFNGLRPHIQALWRGLPVKEQSRFLRHLRPFWDAHRHRLPMEVHTQIRSEFDRGQAILIKGRVEEVRRDGGTFNLEILSRGSRRAELIKADLAFDCTGYRPDLSSPLLSGLIADGLASSDPHGLGLAITPGGNVLGATGGVTRGLFALGPLCQGTLWEITAVPEIVAQADAAAKSIAASQAPDHRASVLAI